ncbi:MAG: response regulator [Deltaproteobacteria bacterium]|nr:response regulator [Deltaproteobacteria bacterium]
MAKRVLLVDDSVTTAKQLESIIVGLNGFEIVGHAKNGAEAVKMYKSLTPDIVCMDIVMPLMDGLQATRAILQLDQNAKVVMISSLGGVGDKVVEALKVGAKDVIAKPFEPEKIKQTLTSL